MTNHMYASTLTIDWARSLQQQRLPESSATQFSKQTTNLGPMHSQLQSPLFKLPAELRTAIYEYTFVAIPDHDGLINIRSEALPSRSLPLTCRRVHQESTAMQCKACDNFLMKDYKILCNGKRSRKMLHDFKLEINIARGNLNGIQLRGICGVSDEKLRCIEHLQVVLFLNLGCSENAARSHIKLRLYKFCGVWKPELTYEHEELDEAAARRELNVKLQRLIQREFEELRDYAERTLARHLRDLYVLDQDERCKQIEPFKYSFNKVSFLILHRFNSRLMSSPLIRSNRSIHIAP